MATDRDPGDEDDHEELRQARASYILRELSRVLSQARAAPLALYDVIFDGDRIIARSILPRLEPYVVITFEIGNVNLADRDLGDEHDWTHAIST